METSNITKYQLVKNCLDGLLGNLCGLNLTLRKIIFSPDVVEIVKLFGKKNRL